MFFDSFCAITRNKIVNDKPIKNVIQGILGAIPGANRLMTKEPNVIFAVSKKKSQVTLDLSLFNISISLLRRRKFVKTGNNAYGEDRQSFIKF